MNMLSKSYMRIFPRYLGSGASSRNFLAEPLKSRSLIRIQGDQVVPFLQGLVTNDINHLVRGSPSIYAMFLNKAGRVLYDSIIYRTPKEDTYLIECDTEVSNELRRHLRMFRVRKKIEIDCIASEYQPWIVFGTDPNSHSEDLQVAVNSNVNKNDVIICRDPRSRALGVRAIIPTSEGIEELKQQFPNDCISATTDVHNYTLHRYTLGVGEGISDLLPGKCFPLEANCDFLHGVSFQKGCYIGQELTARVHHTGVIRKRIMPIALSKPIMGKDVTDVQMAAGKVVGNLRGHLRNRALGLLRVEHVLKTSDLLIDGEPAKTFVPEWWPKELPNISSLKEN